MRTRESEIQANVEFWNSRGIQVAESEIREAIEALPQREGFDFYLVIPAGISTIDVWALLKKEMSTLETMEDEKFRFYATPRSNEATYAVATRYQQGADFICPRSHENRDCKTPLDWESVAKHFMTPIEYMVMAMRWHEENGTLLGEKGATIFPRTRMTTGWMPEMSVCHELVCFDHNAVQYPSGRAWPGAGVREVVAMGEPSVEPIPYKHETPFCL